MNGRVKRLLLGSFVLGLLATVAADRAEAQRALVQGAVQPLADMAAVVRQPIDMRIAKVMGGCPAGGCGEDCCGEDCCGPCCPCGPAGRFWVRADYLMWWTSGQKVPPLVTTNTGDGIGAIGEMDTVVLFGDKTYNDYPHHNFRLQFGYWFGECRIWGIQADYLDLGQNQTNYANDSTGDPLLSRPIYDVLNDQEGVEIIARDGVATGEVSVRAAEDFRGTGVMLRRNLCCHFDCCETAACGEEGCGELACEETGCMDTAAMACETTGCWRVDFIGGYRHYNLQDSVSLNERVVRTVGAGGDPAGTVYDVTDTFYAENEFHGGEIGLIAEKHRGRWSFQAMAKLAMGNNHQTADISGTTVTTVPNFDPVTHTGGLLALEGTNIGNYSRDRFVVIPHFGMEVGYQLSCCSRLYLGYDFLLWTQVARSGELIDRRVNSSYMPPQLTPTGDPLPTFAWNDATFWAQGFNLGLEFRR